MLRLRTQTPLDWLEPVFADFDAFLIDHALCERKASAMAMSFVAHYPDKLELVRAMIDLAQEELRHFSEVYALMEARRLKLGPDRKDGYVRGLLTAVRKDSREYLLDRLLVAGVVEARGCERFGLLAEHLQDSTLRAYYQEVTRAEARHHGLFVRLARLYYPDARVQSRLDELLDLESDVISRTPFTASLH